MRWRSQGSRLVALAVVLELKHRVGQPQPRRRRRRIQRTHARPDCGSGRRFAPRPALRGRTLFEVWAPPRHRSVVDTSGTGTRSSRLFRAVNLWTRELSTSAAPANRPRRAASLGRGWPSLAAAWAGTAGADYCSIPDGFLGREHRRSCGEWLAVARPAHASSTAPRGAGSPAGEGRAAACRPPVSKVRRGREGWHRSGAQVRERDLEARELRRRWSGRVDAASGSLTRTPRDDRADVALAAGANGVHLRARLWTEAGRVRAIAPLPFLIGRSMCTTVTR